MSWNPPTKEALKTLVKYSAIIEERLDKNSKNSILMNKVKNLEERNKKISALETSIEVSWKNYLSRWDNYLSEFVDDPRSVLDSVTIEKQAKKIAELVSKGKISKEKVFKLNKYGVVQESIDYYKSSQEAPSTLIQFKPPEKPQQDIIPKLFETIYLCPHKTSRWWWPRSNYCSKCSR